MSLSKLSSGMHRKRWLPLRGFDANFAIVRERTRACHLAERALEDPVMWHRRLTAHRSDQEDACRIERDHTSGPIHIKERGMYVPSHFADKSSEAQHELIRNNPLGILVTNGQRGPDANHLPFHLDVVGEGLGRLHCHVSRANQLLGEISANDNVLVIFHGPSGYISPNWYPSKHETARQVPTWNYRVLHARGRAVIRDDYRYIRSVVAQLTKTHEAASEKPWKMSDSPREYIDDLLKQIVGIEIEILSFEGKAKLGQDDGVSDMRGAAKGLRTRGEFGLADAIAHAADSIEPPR